MNINFYTQAPLIYMSERAWHLEDFNGEVVINLSA